MSIKVPDELQRAVRIPLNIIIVCKLQLSETVVWTNTCLPSIGGMTWVAPVQGLALDRHLQLLLVIVFITIYYKT